MTITRPTGVAEPVLAFAAEPVYRLKSATSSARCRSERPPTVFDWLIRHWLR